MPDNLPEFRTDDELTAWFEQADLESLDLEEALEVVVSARVTLALNAPWHQVPNTSTATSAQTADAVIDPIIVGAGS